MTQELIAYLLGVRREGITAAAGKLKTMGVIDYSRGHITVLNRRKLEESSCECYRMVRREIERLQPYLCTSRTGVEINPAPASATFNAKVSRGRTSSPSGYLRVRRTS
jgi:hypothetical protein